MRWLRIWLKRNRRAACQHHNPGSAYFTDETCRVVRSWCPNCGVEDRVRVGELRR